MKKRVSSVCPWASGVQRFAAVLVFVCFVCSLHATEYFVSKSGHNTNNDCTDAQSGGSTAKLTLTGVTGGISCLSPGDTLTVEVGTYDEEIIRGDWVDGVSSWATATTYRAKAGDTVILKPVVVADEYVLEIDGKWIIWDGIDLDGTNISSVIISHRSISGVQAHHHRIMNSEIHGTGFTCISQFNDAPDPDNLEWIDNEIHDCGSINGVGHGLYIRTSDGLADGNLIYDVAGYGIHQFRDTVGLVDDVIIRNNITHTAGKSGILLGSGDRNKAYNNLSYDNTDFGIRVGGPDPDDNVAYNNTLFNNGSDCIHINSSPVGTIIKNNICWSNGSDSIVDLGTGTVSSNNLLGSNPLFVNESTKDLHILTGSPAKDQGADLTAEGITDDLDANARPQGSQFDIGAYEFVGDPTPPDPGCGGSAITQNELLTATFDGVSRSTYTTASISPADDALQSCAVYSRDSDNSPGDAPTISGFTQVSTQVTGTSRRLTVLRRLESSATTGTIDIVFPTDAQDYALWQCSEFIGVDRGGTNGADAVVQADAATGGGGTCDVILSAFGDSGNATYMAGGSTSSSETHSAGTGFTLISEENGGGSIGTEWRDDNDTTPQINIAGSTGACIALELKRATACIGLPKAMEVGMEVGMIEGVNP